MSEETKMPDCQHTGIKEVSDDVYQCLSCYITFCWCPGCSLDENGGNKSVGEGMVYHPLPLCEPGDEVGSVNKDVRLSYQTVVDLACNKPWTEEREAELEEAGSEIGVGATELECAVCHEDIKVVVGAETRLGVHGPENDPCPGSGFTLNENFNEHRRNKPSYEEETGS